MATPTSKPDHQTGVVRAQAHPAAVGPAVGDDVVLPVRHPWRWLAAVLVAIAVAGVVWSLAKNPNLHWKVIGQYLFTTLVFEGLWTTIWLTVVAMLIGLAGGTLLAVMRLSDNVVLSALAAGFIWLFRGTPLLVQIIFWGYLGALYPTLRIGIPFTHLTFYSASTSAVVTGSAAAVLALGLNEMAYSAEIVRAGIIGVDPGQTEAAYCLGMSPATTMRRIVLPQAMRVVVPPIGNETITMLKSTALVSVISGHDLLTNLQDVYSQNFEVIPLLVVASIWYLTLTSVLSVPQRRLERRYARGSSLSAGTPGVLQRMTGLRSQRSRSAVSRNPSVNGPAAAAQQAEASR